jgi:hypothetical protein
MIVHSTALPKAHYNRGAEGCQENEGSACCPEAEREGVEPSRHRCSAVFKTAAVAHRLASPYRQSGGWDSNPHQPASKAGGLTLIRPPELFNLRTPPARARFAAPQTTDRGSSSDRAGPCRRWIRPRYWVNRRETQKLPSLPLPFARKRLRSIFLITTPQSTLEAVHFPTIIYCMLRLCVRETLRLLRGK